MDFTALLPLIRDTGLLGLTIYLLWDSRKQQAKRDEDTKEERLRTLAVLDKYGETLLSLKTMMDRVATTNEKVLDELRRFVERSLSK